MKEYKTGQIRNVALISHNGAGKTTLVERLLFNTGAITRMGSVQSGSTAMDFEEEEIARQSSVSAAIAPIEWQDHKFNVIDTPGYLDFIGEVNSSLRVVESAVVLIEAVSGVEVGTESVWSAAGKRGLPRILLVNKMDRDTARVTRVLDSINSNLEGNFINLQLPIGEGPSFKGVVDLLAMNARIGANSEVGPIPDDMLEAAEEAQLALIEAAAEGDDSLMEKYFEEDTLSNEEIIRGLRAGMKAGTIAPIIYAAVEPGIAVTPILELMGSLLPSPAEFGPFEATNGNGETESHEISDKSPLTAFIFKTREDTYGKTSFIRVFGGVLDSDNRIWNVKQGEEARIGTLQVACGKELSPVSKLHSGDIGMVTKLGDANTNDTLCDRGHALEMAAIEQPSPIASVAVHPVSQSDVAKLSQSLHRLISEDLTLTWHIEKATRETILSGMGTTHLSIAVKKIESKFGVHLSTTTPKVPFRETITKSNSSEYTHKKQSGGAGQYARVFLRVDSLDDDAEFEFASEIVGGSISAPFITATEKGCRQALENGALAGFPVVGVKAVVYDGKEHPVDSKEIAFQTAGRECFKKAVLGAGPVLLEPIYEVSVTVPSDYMGDILGDMNSRRARVLGMDQEATKSIVKAEVPLAEMQTYAADLRSMTQGRGVFSMEFLRYGRVPSHLQEQIVEEARRSQEEEN